MELPFTKAYIYESTYINYDSRKCTTKNIIVLKEGIDINSLITSWNDNRVLNGYHKLVEEIPVKKAIYKRGINGSSIFQDWKLLSNMPYCSLGIEIQYYEGIGN